MDRDFFTPVGSRIGVFELESYDTDQLNIAAFNSPSLDTSGTNLHGGTTIDLTYNTAPVDHVIDIS